MPYDDTMFLKNKVDILSLFNEEQLRRVTPDIEHKTYAQGEVVILRGEVTSGLYIVKKGAVKVIMKPKGEPEITRDLPAGGFFGEISLLEDTAATESVKASAEDTEIITIPHDSFQKLCSMMPMIKKALLDKVAAQKKA